tara:strand:+ start:1180 stop:1560 length:381 start_codon:yes stop_codon:yes gene_type:complete
MRLLHDVWVPVVRYRRLTPKSQLAQYIGQVKLVLFIVQNENSMKVINFSEARNRLKSVLDQVVEDADYTVISRRDAEDAVVMSLDQFNGLMETVHLLKSPANATHLAKSVKQYRNGKVKTHDLTND